MSGSVLENSTCYDILKFGKLVYNRDYEKDRRFYKPRTLKDEVRPHILTYRVWSDSMNFRYFAEMVLFGLCVLVFQYYISAFNSDLHKLTDDIELLEKDYLIRRDD